MKLSNEAGFVQATLPRDQLWAVQTPQVFRYRLLREVMIKACVDKFYATDDAALVEHYNFPVKLVPGDYANIKITTPDDLRVAAVIMEGREAGAGRNRL
jgi:2-C-methyl-D-erythritol 4-phosphate cytidylyltransferase